MNPDAINSLATNGPWALLSGVLLVKILSAWQSDRQQLTGLLGEVKPSIDKLTIAVEHLTEKVAK